MRPEPGEDVCGVLLAAGAGRRAGGPKALRRHLDGTSWLVRSIAVLRDGGCASVRVVLGCAATEAQQEIRVSAFADDQSVQCVEAADWSQGLAASLRSGLGAVQGGPWRAALVHLVDLPDVTAAVVGRVVQSAPTGRGALARAVYAGRPGHPVLIGADHLTSIMAELNGDRGAQAYLVRNGVRAVECGDLASGLDHDR